MATEKTAYDRVRDALFGSNSRQLATIPGPNKKGPHASELELWLCSTPKPGRLVIIQRWKAHGGFDAYVAIAAHRVPEAIVEVLGEYQPQLAHDRIGVGLCPVCGHHGKDCTGPDGERRGRKTGGV